MKVLLNVSIARFNSNGSFKVFGNGEVVDLPDAEAERMIALGRAVAIESKEVEVAPAVEKPKLRTPSKRGA